MNKDTQKPNRSNKKRMSAAQRIPRVVFYLQVEGWGPKRIAEAISADVGHSVSRKSIGLDIHQIIESNDIWEDTQARIGWMITIRERHKSLLEEIRYLQAKLRDHRRHEILLKTKSSKLTKADDQFLLTQPEAPIPDKEYYGLQRILNDTSAALDQLMERNILYRKTVQYAKFYEEHQAREWT